MLKKIIILALVILPLGAFAQKFGHINSQLIVQAMPEYTKAQTDMQALEKTYSDELKKIQDEYQKKLDEYQKEQKTLPDNIKQRREQELTDIQTRMQQYYQTSQQDMQKVSQEKMGAISDKISKAIKEIGAAGGYVYIMDVASGIPYISETLSTDVTSAVKTKLGLK